MSGNTRRDFVKTFALLFTGLCTGSFKIVNGFQEKKTPGLEEKVSKVLNAPVVEKIKILRDLEKQFNKEQIKETLHQLLKKVTSENWHKLALDNGKNDLRSYIDLLWTKKSGLQWTERQEGNKTIMHCTYCPYMQEYVNQNATDWGYELLCRTDYYMLEGFNPKIKFERTKTLIQGDEYCNHTYIVEDR